MPTRTFTFTDGAGVAREGRLEMPADGQPRATAVFAHCFGCSKEFKAPVRVSRALAERGVAVLRFDFAHDLAEDLAHEEGDTPGNAAAFERDVADLVAAATALAEQVAAPALLVGHSLGGAAALCAARRFPSVRAVATIAAPASARRSRDATVGHVDEVPLRDGLRHRLRDALGDFDAALLLLHAPDDDVVPVEDAARLYTAAPHPKSFVALPGAGHLLAEPRDAEYAGAMIAAWATPYLGPPPAVPTAGETTLTASTGSEGYRTLIGVRRHTLVVDEPASLGGGDGGPTPYDLVVAALGACTAMTLQMYARRKGWPLDEAIVHLRHARTHGEDADACENRPVRLDRIERELELVGALDDEQRARLAEIADRCPVHRTLEAGIVVTTTLRGATDAE